MFKNLLDKLRGRKKGWYQPNYPKSVEEVLDDKISYREATHEAIRKFKASKPYRGTKAEVQEKFRGLCRDLSAVYKIDEPVIAFVKRYALGSCYDSYANLIILVEEFDGRYSVVVFLHEFGHALHKDEEKTCRWSINLYRKHFPKSYSKLVSKGHLLYKQDSPALEQRANG